MTITYSQLFVPEIVDNSAPDTLYTVPVLPATNLLRNMRIRFANYTAAACTCKAWAIQSGDTAADNNIAMPSISINANDFIDVDFPFLIIGGFIQAQAGTINSITASCIDGFLQST